MSALTRTIDMVQAEACTYGLKSTFHEGKTSTSSRKLQLAEYESSGRQAVRQL